MTNSFEYVIIKKTKERGKNKMKTFLEWLTVTQKISMVDFVSFPPIIRERFKAMFAEYMLETFGKRVTK